MKIVLCGPKGVGKSSLGKKTASFLELPFVDLDTVVGDDLYSLNRLCREESLLIAARWQTVLKKESQEFLRRNFFIVLLKADAAMLRSRLGHRSFRDMDPEISFHDFSHAADRVYESVGEICDLVYEITPKRKSGTHREMGKLILKNYYEKQD